MSKQFSVLKSLSVIILMGILFYNSSCYSYRVGTQAQEGTEMQSAKVNSYLWGLVNKPADRVHTPLCDSLGVNGVSEVVIKKNFGQALATILTLGIWSPARISWKCSKPCNGGDILH